ncbi:Electron transfer flavoprotein alpha subunit [Gluconacetobacter diazotrophicus PA1 5]|uniref:Electron transfer flavoprotein subunit alpha n=2 Tax=Gluconacetobacter diazotrophicus TaxID=33996 RepID=A9HEE9_GLUDA|nr:FAD-binding protein [Gluconacetobacter diazotrophicus]ACI51750.1 Electron transfer flavoprotein alpha subunit [Gluconacetobacter diazotrophicus PA1 5]MBB2155210.1 electron transfer flavoprotein subunit alpha [Gluconacetobacter diazotrophicus]TWB11094.1 electron transfer flavoprotein alpha subunit apoprotein [Gluconacetobacter diazotrophicus]CAP55223.1 Electron transfer flavoprotein subunit alpha [Gluconacetobacter diazotrophicus PA1 5]
MTVLVFLDHESGTIRQASRSAVTAALELGKSAGDVHALVTGDAAVADAAAKIPGIAKVLRAAGAAVAHELAEPLAALIADLAPSYSHIVAAAGATGKNVLPRAAALLDVQPIPDVVSIIDAETFVRPIYAGSALATVKSADAYKVVTVRASSFDPAPAEGGSAVVEQVTVPDGSALSEFVSIELSKSERPELESARVIVSGGRGLQNQENFKLLDPLADRLGAAIGASRAAVDAGFVPNDYQVGQTGKIVAPDLYIAIGISGAIQHLAGMKDSKVIVAINKDPEAPIFQVADYGLVADLFEVLPQLEAALG